MSAKKYYNVKAGPDRPDSVVAKNADVLERAAEVKRLRAGGQEAQGRRRDGQEPVCEVRRRGARHPRRSEGGRVRSGDARRSNVFEKAEIVRGKAAKVRELREYGLTLAALAKRFGVSAKVIGDILKEEPRSVRNY